MEHTWFLTERSKRKLEAAQNAADAIEEGHDTDEEEEDDASDGDVVDKAKQDNQRRSDDDPLSPFSCDDLKSPLSFPDSMPQLDTVTTQASLPIGRSIEMLDALVGASQGDSGASGSYA